MARNVAMQYFAIFSGTVEIDCIDASGADAAQWNARIMMLQGIHQRLSLLFISSQAIEGVPVMFTAKELKELEEAIRSFASFVRQRIPASREREDVLQGVEYLRKQVASMLDR